MGVDAIILAGTRGCKPLETSYGTDFKQFLRLGGKPILRYVLDACVKCPIVDRTYLVSERADVLSVLDSRASVTVLPDTGSPVENIRKSFNQNILQDSFNLPFLPDSSLESYLSQLSPFERLDAADKRVLVLFSDMPFINSSDISHFIETSDPFADYVAGFAHEDSFDFLESQVGHPLCCPETKTALFPFDDTYVRSNNMFLVKPLSIPQHIWDIAQDIYENRHLLKKDGSDNSKKWRRIGSLIKDYAQKYSSFSTLFSAAFRFGAWAYAHRTGFDFPRIFLSKASVQDLAYDLSGRTARGSANIGCLAHPALDVDNAEMFERLIEDDEILFVKTYMSKRFYQQGPVSDELALMNLENSRPALFEGGPEKHGF